MKNRYNKEVLKRFDSVVPFLIVNMYKFNIKVKYIGSSEVG